MIHKVTNIFVGNGTALETSIDTLTPGKLGIFGNDNTPLAAGETIATVGKNSIIISETYADGTPKRSMLIKGSSVIAARSENYAPAQREVWVIGYNRKTLAGSIDVIPSTEYTYSIVFKNDKTFYSERPEVLRNTFTSGATATELTIATTIASGINNSSFKSQVEAKVVGNGTGVLGLTGASHYGVEITAKIPRQFTNSTYAENRVYFSVHTDDSTGFGSTSTTQIVANSAGQGTYNWLYNKEKYLFQYEGYQNLTSFPVQVQTLNASSTGALTSSITTVTTTVVLGDDKIVVGSTTNLRPGEILSIGGQIVEVKYIVNATTLIVVNVFTSADVAAILSTTAILAKYFYDTIVVEFNDLVSMPGADSVNLARKSVYIATPAINAGQAYTADSTEKAALIASLNPWLASTPANPPALA